MSLHEQGNSDRDTEEKRPNGDRNRDWKDESLRQETPKFPDKLQKLGEARRDSSLEASEGDLLIP